MWEIISNNIWPFIGTVGASAVVSGLVASYTNYFFNERSRKKERIYKEKRDAYFECLKVLHLRWLCDYERLDEVDYPAVVAIMKMFAKDDVADQFQMVWSQIENVERLKTVGFDADSQYAEEMAKLTKLMRKDLGLKNS